MWSVLIRPFWDTNAPGWAGLVLCFIAIIGFAFTLVSFGDSFRVGIDVNKPEELVTSGMFAISRNPIDIMVWICIVSVLIEGIVLMIFKGKCPFTILGYNYAENPQVGFDIFLPTWLAKNNKLIFSTIFFIGFVLVLFRVFIE